MVFLKSVIRRRARFWVPTALMIVVGCIKYLERTQALYYANTDNFRDSLEMDQGRVDPSTEGVAAGVNPNFTTTEGDPNVRGNGNTNDFQREDEDELVVEAYDFYNKFKGLIVDNFLSSKDRKECRDIFLNKEESKAFKIIEVELDLMYDVFYTKAFLLDSKQTYLRVISSILVFVSLLWFAVMDKRNFYKVDVDITYVLLVGAIALDLCAIVMIILSDWYIITTSISNKIIGKRKSRPSSSNCHED
ncbi:hypothetical protein RND81_10G100800 [Saponaria officinalis]|uniref:DUF4220 domain-containing protein n=1 Tax=Saponaria officinalis TaxID=3572 RepID=A0AAW1I082_SAPOF